MLLNLLDGEPLVRVADQDALDQVPALWRDARVLWDAVVHPHDPVQHLQHLTSITEQVYEYMCVLQQSAHTCLHTPSSKDLAFILALKKTTYYSMSWTKVANEAELSLITHTQETQRGSTF